MASGLARLELWDGLDAVSGKVRLAADLPIAGFVTTCREDGDDTATLTMPLAHPAASQVVTGTVLRQIGEDASVVEWIVVVVEEAVHDDVLTVSCGAARTWLATAPIDVVDQTLTDNPTNILNTIRSSTGWPAWATNGTIQPTGTVTVQFAGETGLSAVLKLVAAIDATLADGDPPCVLRFRRASDSSYVLDILTTPPTGTAYLLEGKNITRLSRRRDATGGASVTSYGLEVVDLYRHAPADYPRDNLVPYETCRFGSGSLGVDTTVRIAEVVTDFRDSLGTRVQLGAPRRRLIRETESVATQASPATPVPAITPGTMTDTEVAYTIAATIASGTVRRQVTPRGTTATGSTYGPISDGTSADLVNGEVLTVARPAPGDPPATVIVDFFGSDGGAALVVLDITAQPDPTPTLTVVPGTMTDTARPYTISSSISVGTVAVTVVPRGCTASGSTFGAIADGSSALLVDGEVVTVTRPDVGDPPATMVVTATSSAGVVVSVVLEIPTQPDPAPSLDLQVTPDTADYEIAYTYVGTIEVSIDGGSWGAPASSPITVSRDAAGGDDKVYVFRVTQHGQTVSNTVVVPAQSTAPGGTVPPSIDVFYVSGEDLSGNTQQLTFSGSNEPSGVTYDLTYRVTITDRSTGLVDEILFGSVGNITSPYNLGISGLDLVTKGTSGWRDLSYALLLQMKNTSPAVVATAETSAGSYGIYTP